MTAVSIKPVQPDFQQIGKPEGKRKLPPDVMPLLDYKRTFDQEGNERSAKICQTVRNWETVLLNDCRFTGKIKFDEFARRDYLTGAVPWDEENSGRPWSNHDDSALFSIIQAEYGLTNRQDYFDAIKNVSRRQKFHPVREKLESLEWDGREHIRYLLPDYLGAEDTQYNYEVIKLWMLGAISRIYQPGCKFDYTMILEGTQGAGKSTFLRKMALRDEWFSDSLDSLDGKDAAEALTGSWTLELAEMKSLSRTSGGVESVKRFLTAQSDKYRAPYARRTDIIPRQCVFAGTSNRSDFLTDQSGNRRFLIIYIGIVEPRKNLFSSDDEKTDFEQAWAEAMNIYRTQKPELILPKSCMAEAKKIQEENLADDGLAGIVTEYLKDKKRVCALEIWQEALQENGRPQKWQSSEINAIIEKTPGWHRMKSPAKFGEYGSQRGYECSRECSSDFEDDDEETPFDD